MYETFCGAFGIHCAASQHAHHPLRALRKPHNMGWWSSYTYHVKMGTSTPANTSSLQQWKLQHSPIGEHRLEAVAPRCLRRETLPRAGSRRRGDIAFTKLKPVAASYPTRLLRWRTFTSKRPAAAIISLTMETIIIDAADALVYNADASGTWGDQLSSM